MPLDTMLGNPGLLALHAILMLPIFRNKRRGKCARQGYAKPQFISWFTIKFTIKPLVSHTRALSHSQHNPPDTVVVRIKSKKGERCFDEAASMKAEF